MKRTDNISIPARDARIIAGMLRGYHSLLAKIESDAPGAEMLLRQETNDAIRLREDLLSKVTA